jgi:hypothetical protein
MHYLLSDSSRRQRVNASDASLHKLLLEIYF